MLPEIKVRITADPTDATRGLDRVQDEIRQTGDQADVAKLKVQNFGGGLRNMGRMSGQARAGLQNASYQIQDIIVQLQMGTQASRVFSQQLPQLASGFGFVGAMIGTGVGLAIPLLAMAFRDATEAAKTLDDAMEELGRVSDGLRESAHILNMDMAELTERYGTAALKVREFAVAQAQLRVALAENRLRDQIGVVRDVIGEYTAAASHGQLLSSAMDDLARKIGLTADQASNLQAEFGRLNHAQTFDMQRDALRHIVVMMADYGVAASELPPELAEALDVMLSLVQETMAAGAAADRLAASIDETGDGLTFAVGQAAALASNLASAASVNIRGALSGLGDTGGGILGTVGGWLGLGNDGGGVTVPPPPPPPGGGAARRNPAILALIESLQTEREALESWYAESLTLLDDATGQELALIGDRNEAKLRLAEEYRDRLAGIQQQTADSGLLTVLKSGEEILGALSSSNERIFKMQQAFGAAIAMVNAYQGAAEVLGDVSVPFWTKFSAAASVLATGLGFAASIRSLTSSGSGGGGGVSASSSASGGGGAAPLNVQLNPVDPSALYSGAQLNSLFDQLNQVAGDRGYVLV